MNDSPEHFFFVVRYRFRQRVWGREENGGCCAQEALALLYSMQCFWFIFCLSQVLGIVFLVLFFLIGIRKPLLSEWSRF